MFIIAEGSGYALEVGADLPTSCIVERLPDGRWARFHCRVYRSPSQKTFVLRCHADATEQDRAHAGRLLEAMPANWSSWPKDLWFERPGRDGHPQWMIQLGYAIADPLFHLELEMLIDGTQGALRELAEATS